MASTRYKVMKWHGRLFLGWQMFRGELLNFQGVWFRNKNWNPQQTNFYTVFKLSFEWVSCQYQTLHLTDLTTKPSFYWQRPSEPAHSGRPQKGSWAVRSAPEPQKGSWAVRSALEPQKDSRAVHSCPAPSAKVSSDLKVERRYSRRKKNSFKVSKGRNKDWEKLFPQVNITKQNISEIKWTVPHQKKNETLHVTFASFIVSICWSIYFLAWIFPQKIRLQNLTSWIQDLSFPLWDTLTLCTGWKMDPDCRFSCWKWRYSSRPY